MQRFSPKASSVLKKKIFKGFYHIRAWRPPWLMDCDHFSNFSFLLPKEAPYEIWAKLAQGLQRRSRLKMLTDGRADAWTDNRRKMITIAHPEHSSGELIIIVKKKHLPCLPGLYVVFLSRWVAAVDLKLSVHYFCSVTQADVTVWYSSLTLHSVLAVGYALFQIQLTLSEIGQLQKKSFII